MHVPGSIGDVSADWLSNALDSSVSIRSVERIGEGYGLASEVYRVRLVGSDTESVVVKLWRVEPPAGTTEISFYRELATSIPIGVPKALHGAESDTHAVLVLEDIEGRQGDVLVRPPASEQDGVASTIARIHGTFWADLRLDRHSWLRNGWTGPSDEWFDSRPAQFIERFGPVDSTLGRRLLADPRATFRAGTARLRELPHTLVHGDLHLDNILFADQPVILDWAGCRRGPGMQDLASVIFSMGDVVRIEELLEVYRVGLATEGADVSLDQLQRALGGAVLWSFLFWTLGTARWQPDDDRGHAMQSRHHADAVAMVELWAEQEPELFAGSV